MGESPTARRRHVGAELRRLREAARISREQVAELLECSISKVTKIELGDVAIKRKELDALLDTYGAPADGRSDLLAVAREAKKRDWYSSLGAPGWFRKFLGLESSATEIKTFEAELIPGVIQTEDYVRAVIEAVSPELPAGDLERRMQVRSERQAQLFGQDPPRFTAIFSEAAIRRVVGGPKVMSAQLKFLVEAQSEPHIELQVLPFRAGAHAAIGFTFILLQFASDDVPSVAYLEDLTSAAYLDKSVHLQTYRLAFDRLRGAALGPADSAVLIKQAIGELE